MDVSQEEHDRSERMLWAAVEAKKALTKDAKGHIKALKAELARTKAILESILCLCSEGPEFYHSGELLEAIEKEAKKAWDQ